MRGKKMNYVDSFEICGVEAKEIPCIKNAGSPSDSTVGAVGLLYMDTGTGEMRVVDGVLTTEYRNCEGGHCMFIYGWDERGWLVQNSWERTGAPMVHSSCPMICLWPSAGQSRTTSLEIPLLRSLSYPGSVKLSPRSSTLCATLAARRSNPVAERRPFLMQKWR